ncbi:MAG: hypothetical protein JHC93_07710 [Parachlamydiales bacterium]|nr:hypothetical protein [Parachlamydiales bacterium]
MLKSLMLTVACSCLSIGYSDQSFNLISSQYHPEKIFNVIVPDSYREVRDIDDLADIKFIENQTIFRVYFSNKIDGYGDEVSFSDIEEGIDFRYYSDCHFLSDHIDCDKDVYSRNALIKIDDQIKDVAIVIFHLNDYNITIMVESLFDETNKTKTLELANQFKERITITN